MKKNNSGFSLVELIVVIAIMAILAGIAVPTYVKYIAKANDAVVYNELDEVKTAAIAASAKEGKTVTEIKVTPGTSIKVEVKYSSSDTEYTDITAAVTALLDDASIFVTGTSYANDLAIIWNKASGWADPTGSASGE